MARLRLLFAANLHWNAGSSHMIAEYARVAGSVGCEVGVSTQLSRMDSVVPAHLPLVDDLAWATHLVLVFEGRQFLNDDQVELCARIPRERRVIIDPDAHWGPVLRDGLDVSHGTYSQESWIELYRGLADLVLQPKIDGPLPDGAQYFSYFGMPDVHRRATHAPVPFDMAFQIQYIGSNWWRWPQVAGLVEAALRANPRPRSLRVCGRWWDGSPHEGHTCATASTRGWLRSRGVGVAPSVPFGQVVSEMSRSAITPILVRPTLAKCGLLTPRMLETIASGSLPLIGRDLKYLVSVYGDEAFSFTLGDDASDAIGRLLSDYARLRRAVDSIQERVHATFNYRHTLRRLVTLLNG